MSKPDLLKPAAARQHIAPSALPMWRERMGYAPKDACEALGCSPSELQDWEAGHRPVPLYIGLAMAALAMDLSPYGAKAAA